MSGEHLPASRAARASYAQRLRRRAGDANLALCVGIDPSPDAVALLADPGPSGLERGAERVARAAAIERFGGMVVEAVRDHAVAVKPQLAWYEAAGAPGLRALERTVEYARRAGLLVILDGKRGDVPHSAAVYADAWLGEDAASGIRGDALTINAGIGADAVEAMAAAAAERGCGLYALLHTSNPGAPDLQGAQLASGGAWWELLARELARVDAAAGPGVVGAVVGATHPDALAQARALLPAAPLLLPGVGAQGGEVPSPRAAAAPSEPEPPVELVAASRSLLPAEPLATAGFRFAVTSATARLAARLAVPRDAGTPEAIG